MIRIHTLAATATALVLATVSLEAQSHSQYREFRLGSPLASVQKTSGVATADMKSLQRRPANIQELRWRPSERFNDRMMPTESAREVIFTFYNDQLFKIVVDYDSQRTDGLTDADLIDAFSATYGVPVLQASSLRTNAPAGSTPLDGDTVVAQWSDADTSLTLVRGTYPKSLRLVMAVKATESLAQHAAAEAARLDREEAPQRELERVNKLAEDGRVAAEKARAANKPLFKP
jgi:hypothetical protein